MANIFADLIIFLFFIHSAFAQFPRACIQNATRPGAICCPPLPSQPSGQACGGPDRGTCAPYVMRSSQRSFVPLPLANDDRLDWPTRFFRFGCACKGNFWGYACHRCRPGWTGASCEDRAKPRVRRNALTLTSEQKKMFHAVLNRAKTLQSDFVVLNISSSENGDPVPFSPKFFNVSVYDYLIYVHVYAARSTLLKSNMTKCLDSGLQRFDFAHNGTGFLPWHRFYLTVVEAELDDVAKNEFGAKEPFALPYWDWTNGGFNCSVCTNDLAGAFNASDPQYSLDHRSAFHNWTGFCRPKSVDTDGCHICDPTKQFYFLWRRPISPALPPQSEVDYAMSLTTFDVPPYDYASDASSFRNVLEGYIDKRNMTTDSMNGIRHMHNLVHTCIEGSWLDIASSPADPLFFFHHSFVEKIYDMWLTKRRQKPSPEEIPRRGKVGHARGDHIVPFFPVEKLEDYHCLLSDLGVTYDTSMAGTYKLQELAFSAGEPNSIDPNYSFYIIITVLEGFVMIVAMSMIIAWTVSRINKYRKRSWKRSKPGIDQSETSPLIMKL